jgi:uncharacterized membrane protein
MSKPVSKTTDFFFRFGLIVKGVDSVFEVFGAILLFMPMRLERYFLVLSQHEIYRHHEAMAGRIDHLADRVLEHASVGEAAYLAIHGLAKVILIAAIYRDKRWGYVGLMGVLTLFACIELVRAFTAREVVTGILSGFDILMVVLIFKEYRSHFSSRQTADGKTGYSDRIRRTTVK